MHFRATPFGFLHSGLKPIAPNDLIVILWLSQNILLPFCRLSQGPLLHNQVLYKCQHLLKGNKDRLRSLNSKLIMTELLLNSIFYTYCNFEHNIHKTITLIIKLLSLYYYIDNIILSRSTIKIYCLGGNNSFIQGRIQQNLYYKAEWGHSLIIPSLCYE